MTRRLLPRLLFVALSLAALSPAEALDSTINPLSGLAANGPALSALERAATRWETIFSDPITVEIDANLLDLGNPFVIGQASSILLIGGYDSVRNQIQADAADEPTNGIAVYVPSAATSSAYAPTGFGLSGALGGTRPHLKAMGFAGLDAMFGPKNATISFNSALAFDFDSSNGIGAWLMDFETVAAHDIGHALGFVSVVDAVDRLLSQDTTANTPLYALDLLRFSDLGDPNSNTTFTRLHARLCPTRRLSTILITSGPSRLDNSSATGARRVTGR